MKPVLVILSTNLGRNFSGGSLATHEIFVRIQKEFSSVVFVGRRVGDHSFENLSFKSYRNPVQAVRLLLQLKNRFKNVIFFSDFYQAQFFLLAGLPFYFAYHDNWPELAQYGWRNKLRGLFFTNIYKRIIRASRWTFTVSSFKYGFVSHHSTRSSIVRNGTLLGSREKGQGASGTTKKKVLMLGNVDGRKYDWALPLFNLLDRTNPTFEIHIYGHTINRQLASKLTQFSFVKLKGFTRHLHWPDYKCLLSTSKMENLAISVVESVKSGIPVVGYDVGGLKEVVDRGNGSLVRPGDSAALMEKLLLVINEETSFPMRPSGLESYDWDIAAEAYLQKIFEDD